MEPSSLALRGLLVGVCFHVFGCADPCVDDGLGQGGCPEQPGSDGTQTQADTPSDAGSADADQSASQEQGSASSDGATGSMSADADDTVGAACPMLNEVLMPRTPTIHLVVDQSRSMSDDLGGQTRWNALRGALLDPTTGIIPTLQSSIRFGFTLYTGTPTECPQIEGLPPEIDAFAAIAPIYNAARPEAETPTGESLDEATQILIDDPAEGDKYLVLATDGEPDTCAVPTPMNEAEQNVARARALQAVQDAYAAGFQTFIISVGDEIGADHVQDLANAGIGAEDGETAPFYSALDPESLRLAFESIVGDVRGCELTLASAIPNGAAASCVVTLNDNPVPFDDPDGWALPNDTTIELRGSSCATIRSEVVTVAVACTCEPG